MKAKSRKRGEQSFSAAVVMKKWLNIKPKTDDFSQDEWDSESSHEDDEFNTLENDSADRNHRSQSIFGNDNSGIARNIEPKLRRRKSETVRVQYINTKDIKISVNTWNVAGKLPSEDLEIEEWLNLKDDADIYVLGFQEVVPLNAVNVLGAEDNSPLYKWEALIRKTLNQAPKAKMTCKSYSAPPSPRAKLSDVSNSFVDELLAAETDSNEDMIFTPQEDGIETINSPWSSCDEANLIRTYSKHERIKFVDLDYSSDSKFLKNKFKRVSSSPYLDKSSSKRPVGRKENLFTDESKGYNIFGNHCLIWPEPSLDTEELDLLPNLDSFDALKRDLKESAKAFASLDTSRINSRRMRGKYIRIFSKQMVGLFVSVWVRRTLRSHIHNLKVSSVGVGVMGYMGNKGSISVSMSVYQTSICFVCCHLTSGEKEGCEVRRNYDVLEILRRTRFPSDHGVELPETIMEHDCIIWFGDLNYRLSLSNAKAWKLINEENWEELIRRDQLRIAISEGHIFEEWQEGGISFPPTYKYEFNSDVFYNANQNPGEKKRTPAWCDRILWLGRDVKQLSYRRSELSLSDHRPVNSLLVAKMEVFSRRKLQKALMYTNAELNTDST